LLRKAVEADIKDSAPLQHFVSTTCLVRYLRARSWKIKDATKMLQATIEWRKQYKPEEIGWDDIKSEAATGKQYLLPDPNNGGHATDRAGRPVLIMRPRCENTRDYETQMKYVVYHLETSSWLADKSATSDARMCWIVDFVGYSYATSPPLKQAITFLHIMQNHYPERLGVAIAYRAPRIFSFMWRGLQPVMDPVTRSKVVFIEGKEDTLAKQLSKLIDTALLDTTISGTTNYVFDVKEYEQIRRESDAIRQREFGVIGTAMEAGR